MRPTRDRLETYATCEALGCAMPAVADICASADTSDRLLLCKSHLDRLLRGERVLDQYNFEWRAVLSCALKR